jgi:hypothetical protein
VLAEPTAGATVGEDVLPPLESAGLPFDEEVPVEVWFELCG